MRHAAGGERGGGRDGRGAQDVDVPPGAGGGEADPGATVSRSVWPRANDDQVRFADGRLTEARMLGDEEPGGQRVFYGGGAWGSQGAEEYEGGGAGREGVRCNVIL